MVGRTRTARLLAKTTNEPHSLRVRQGFTIVELLIVVVVIAILAAITIVAYNGINNRAKDSALQTTAKQAYTKIQVHAAQNAEQYPTALSDIPLTSPSNMTYQYYVNNASNPRKFCISTNNQTSGYFLSNIQSTPKAGTCNDQNLVSTSINDWVQGDYSQTTGNPSSNPSSRIRQPYLVAVEPGATYTLNLNTSSYSFVIRSFDSNQAFVASVGGVTSGSTYTVPSGVSYLGVGIYGSSSADYNTYSQMFTAGTMVPSIIRQ